MIQIKAIGADEVRAIADDMGKTPADFRALASKGPDAANLVTKMLIALKVDPKSLDEIDQITSGIFRTFGTDSFFID